MIKKLFSFLLVLVCLWSCKADKITIPAYVQIDNYTVKANYGTYGTSDQKFTDMLVYANGQSSGTFPVGKPIPVISSGPTTILIRGVVEINGVSAVRADYELMDGCDTLISVTPGKVTVIKPVFKYFPGIVPEWVDDFDGLNVGGIILTNPTPTDTTTHIVSPGFGGTGHCLALRPNAVSTTSQVNTSTSTLYLPSGGVGVYMELNYLSNVSINLSITGLGSGTGGGTTLGLGGVYPSAIWNKVYLDLTEQVSNLQDPSGYYLTIYCTYDGSLGPNYAYLDNIKVISKQ